MKHPATITAAEYQRLVETVNKRRAGIRKPKGHPEHDVQVACVAWFRAEYPEDAAMLFAVPNGGKRGKAEAAWFKAEGVTAGVSDLIYLEARGGYGALCIETKTRRRGSGQSEKQEEWQRDAERHGNKYVVARDLAEFCREITAYRALPRMYGPTVVRVTVEELNRAERAVNLAKKAKF